MDFETAIELIRDTDGTVAHEEVLAAVQWIRDNDLVDEAIEEFTRYYIFGARRYFA